MKNLLIALSLTVLAACVSTPIDTVAVGSDTPMSRQIGRVLERHDAYVKADIELESAAAFEGALAESDSVRTLILLPEVRRDMLGSALAPVMDRHDGYVQKDPALEDIERDSYLASTAQLRQLLLSFP